MWRKKTFLVIVALLAGVFGCSALSQPKAQTIQLTSFPSGVPVMINGVRQPGLTPMDVHLDPRHRYEVEFVGRDWSQKRWLMPETAFVYQGPVKVPVDQLPRRLHGVNPACQARGC